MNKQKVIVKSIEETKDFVKSFALRVREGDTILLNGDLGAGKTTFTQILLKTLGVNEVVNSPTFAILKTYYGKFKFNHFDTYRITTEEAIEAGFDEVLEDENCVNIIEWSENIAPILPEKTIKINIKIINDTTREIEIDE